MQNKATCEAFYCLRRFCQRRGSSTSAFSPSGPADVSLSRVSRKRHALKIRATQLAIYRRWDATASQLCQVASFSKRLDLATRHQGAQEAQPLRKHLFAALIVLQDSRLQLLVLGLLCQLLQGLPQESWPVKLAAPATAEAAGLAGTTPATSSELGAPGTLFGVDSAAVGSWQLSKDHGLQHLHDDELCSASPVHCCRQIAEQQCCQAPPGVDRPRS